MEMKHKKLLVYIISKLTKCTEQKHLNFIVHIVDNEYASEKLSAIFCLEEITKYLNPQIIDYYDDCYAELKNLSLFVHMNIRKESYLGLANLISYLHDYCNANLEKMNETNRNKLIQSMKLSQNLTLQLSTLFRFF